MRARLATVGALAVLAGCSVQGLNFVEDTRVSIDSPADRAEVSLPFTLVWSVQSGSAEDSFADLPGIAAFGVFVDRAPMPPGESLDWLFRDDPKCDTGCASDERLAALGVVVTRSTELVVDRVASTVDGERHEATIVYLDGAGRRVGESAFGVTFRVVTDGRR